MIALCYRQGTGIDCGWVGVDVALRQQRLIAINPHEAAVQP